MPDLADSRRQILRLFAVALKVVGGRAAVRRTLAARPISGPVWFCAIGKAAESMTLGACDALGDRCVGGILITKTGHLNRERLAALGIESHVGGHPVPTAGSLAAGTRLLAAIREAPRDATLLCLISGGASSLAEAPIEGFGLADLERMNRWLLGSGLPIDAVNRVRKSVSRIKGGGLLHSLADRAVRCLAISDVPGNDPGVIGSGLLVPDPNLAETVADPDLPEWLADWVRRGLTERGAMSRAGPAVELIATLDEAKTAVARAAAAEDLPYRLHEAFIAGDAAQCGQTLARALLEGPPGLHIWGGETTVRLPATPGRGGRNQHLALAAAIEITGRNDCLLLSAGTDGTDGPTEDAGALVDGGTVERAELAGFNVRESLARADAGRLLEASGDLICTGPTGTNVMDLMLGLKM